MPGLSGYATFPGIQQVLRADYTRSHGISPSVCTIEIVPQANFTALVGDLVFVFGNTRLVFHDSRIDQVSFRYNEQGLVWQLSILDRRWKWQFGEISGSYNLRVNTMLPGGTVDAFTLKTPSELASLCLGAMGEGGYDVSQMPNDSRPEIQWDRDNPARSLADLAESLGCRVVLKLNNTVMVARTGVGADLPADGIMQDGLVFHPPQRPDRIKVVCGKTRYQVDFDLEAVGKDVDGSVKPIDNLSYRPIGGWGSNAGNSPPFFGNVAGWEIDPTVPPGIRGKVYGHVINPRQLAIETVFRWYRISMKAIDNTFKTPQIPGWGGFPGRRIQELWQILPIEDIQVIGWYDVNNDFHSEPADVWGRYTEANFAFTNTDGTAYYEEPFTIDQEQGIFQFSDYVYELTPQNKAIPADLHCRVAVSVRDYETGAWDRYERELVYPGQPLGTAAKILKREEIQLNIVPIYRSNHTVARLVTTEAEVRVESDYYLGAADLEYQIKTPQDRVYMGLVAIDLDGAIQQVTWSVGERGATTRASRNNEWNPAVPNFRERRKLERLTVVAQTNPQLLSRVRRKGDV